MWDLAVREGDYARADSLVRRRYPDPPWSIRAIDAFARGDSAARARILADARRSDGPGALFAAQWIAQYLGDLATAEQVAHFATAPRQRPGVRAAGHRVLAQLELAGGRWRAAAAEFTSAERLGAADSVREGHALAATLPFLAVPRADLEEMRAEIERWVPGSEVPQRNLPLTAALRPGLRLYMLGLLSSRLGADADALGYAGELEGLQVAEAGTVIRSWAQTVRATIAARRGRLAEGVAALGSVRGEIPLELVDQPPYSEEQARYLRAELLYQLGRYDEARRWFETSLQTSFPHTGNEVIYLAPSHLRLAEIYEHLGEREKAADHYSRFIGLWKNCDPELRPLVEEARSRLAAVLGEPVRH
jgi:tetratricopeptide (TPR) repeat protein